MNALLHPPDPQFIADFASSSWSESRRRRVLRPHWEDRSGITNPEEIKLREQFDGVMGWLLTLELAGSTEYLGLKDTKKRVTGDMRKLLALPAVARFIDDYAYFGVRFLASRLGIALCGLPDVPAPRPEPAEPGVIETFFNKEIELRVDTDVQAFLNVLDDFIQPLPAPNGRTDRVGACQFRLWLRGKDMQFEQPAQDFCRTLTRGAIRWCTDKARLYKSCDLIIQTRLAIFDFYWLMKLFGAEVSTSGIVTYKYPAWFDDLYSGAADADETKALIEAQKIFLQATSLACNWIQGAPLEPATPEQGRPLVWNQVFCEELNEIAHYRRERPEEPEEAGPAGPSPGDAPGGQGSPLPGLKIRPNLVGLAFSGGGIRSATFNLGVLEALKDLDLLRRIDYLSTVSGGGYIGAWLVGNARRRPAWLGKAADWRESIRYLRQYANYLSPRVGLLSADTWNMWAIWSRNTMLIQVLLFLSIAVALMVPHVAECIFWYWANAAAPTAGAGGGLAFGLPFLLLIISAAGTAGNLCNPKTRCWILPFGQGLTQWLIVVPLLGASLLFAAILWDQAGDRALMGATYPTLLLKTWESWLWPGIGFLLLAGCLSWASIHQSTPKNLGIGGLTTIISVAAVYAALCGILRLFVGWRAALGIRGNWYAFTVGPSLVLVAFTLTIVLVLGLLSRASNEDIREWWSRLGAWLSIYAGVWLLLALAGVFLPLWMAELVEFAGTKWNATGVLGWIATTVGGLLAGRSPSTGNTGPKSASQIAQEWLARLAPLVFIAGLVAGLASVVHALLLYAFGEWPEAGQYVNLYWQKFDTISGWAVVGCMAGVAVIAFLYSLRLDLNIFGLNSFYRNRLVRCYLGATRDDRKAQAFTGFDDEDDLPLSDLVHDRDPKTPYTGPFPIVNCALNLGGSSDLELHTRHSASFTLTPLHAGASRQLVGYAPLGAEDALKLGQAIAVSGAAASPNMGYHTSPVVAFLLTVFNVRLGWWFPNPAKLSKVEKTSPTFSLGPLVQELFGAAGEKAGFLNLSDGGHFDNLGIYELVRRRCRVIIASDAECDRDLTFGSLGNVIRICEVDFGTKIEIDVASIRKRPDTGVSASHCAVGKIHYNDGTEGYLIYMKSSLTANAETAVLEYKASHPDFPHETTADQFFSDDQFESYRMLGRSVATRTFRDIDPGAPFLVKAENLCNLWTPKLTEENKFGGLTRALTELWSKLQSDPNLQFLGHELFAGLPASPPPTPAQVVSAFYYYNQVIQLMENVFLDLQLDDTWEHPDNAGWKSLFQLWANSATFQSVWTESRMTYGLRFRQFCQRSLGLS